MTKLHPECVDTVITFFLSSLLISSSIIAASAVFILNDCDDELDLLTPQIHNQCQFLHL